MVYRKKIEPIVTLTPVEEINLAEGSQELIAATAAQYVERFNLAQEKNRFSQQFLDRMPEPSSKVIYVDDFSAISHIDKFKNVITYCTRAFTRARDGDVVLATLPIQPGLQEYLSQRLGLGLPTYIRVDPTGASRDWSIFEALLLDQQSQQEILKVAGEDTQLVIHPYLSSLTAWEVAETLSRSLKHPVKVLGPLPTVGRIANNKNHFLSICRAVCGAEHCIDWVEVDCLEEMHKQLVAYSKKFDRVVLRHTSSATGVATVVFQSEKIDQWHGEKLRRVIQQWLLDHNWFPGESDPLQISGWESKVLASPSAQLWLPPERSHLPIVEEVLDQLFLADDPKVFNGSRISQLPKAIIEEIKRLAFMVGFTLREMGYVGRCSFDLIVTGTSLIDDWQVKFVECNGRWGGGSIPMTLMNRLFYDHRSKPYAHRVVTAKKLIGVTFAEFIEIFNDILYDANTFNGWAIVYNVALLESHGQFDLIAIGSSSAEAEGRRTLFEQLIRERV